jgi:lamin tail-like protein
MRRALVPGIHVCQVVPQTTDPRGEYVVVANDGTSSVPLTGLEITDYTMTQQHVHVYRFPQAQGNADLILSPGEEAYVFTGHGQNQRLGDGDLLLFAERSAPIWNNTGDVAYLRRLDGTFVDSMTVGDPPRHPNGH